MYKKTVRCRSGQNAESEVATRSGCGTEERV